MTPWLVALPVVVAAATASPSSPSRTVVTCLDAHGTPARVVKPKACTFVLDEGVEDIGATRVTLAQLRWKGWGTATATGTGTIQGNMGSRSGGTVRLSRPRTCPGRRTKAYTRIAVRPAGQKQASVVALAGCG